MDQPRGETVGQRSPVEIFDGFVYGQEAEYAQLRQLFVAAMDVVGTGDIDQFNERITHSGRDDLAMTRQIPQSQPEGPNEIEQTNNFIPNMCGFGVPIFEKDEWLHTERLKDYQPYTEAQTHDVFELSGCGGYNECLAIANVLHIDNVFAERVASNTHTKKPAFARMWVMFPELTGYLMEKCLKREGESYKQKSAELYVAYTIMSRLVDEGDPHVAQSDGSYDDWALCL